ncbi:hypothetical protein [Rugamonas apoptosis]|uniref:Uncharacterized protein n=1 Tax=Rugamonas apoptosis TaxID=2758570 RepID=A0A7W2F7W4_9BURK|nr:hypothetical protein [Rugamonas apoptosis]MBA5686740.1 hypothetical protein [Rugamonas apoptosis]
MHIHEASAQQVTHPILIIAAVAVVLFCGVGTAAILGWLPSSQGSAYQPVPVIQQPAPAMPPAQQAIATRQPVRPVAHSLEAQQTIQAAAPEIQMAAPPAPEAPVADPAGGTPAGTPVQAYMPSEPVNIANGTPHDGR